MPKIPLKQKLELINKLNFERISSYSFFILLTSYEIKLEVRELYHEIIRQEITGQLNYL